MWLALGECHDPHLRWAVAGLRARGLRPLELVTAQELAGLRCSFWLGDAHADFELALADGRILRSREVRGVLNRLWTVPTSHFAALHPDDRLYAECELYATLWACLAALPGPVLNPPSTTGLCGLDRDGAVWAREAQRAGLPTAPWRGAPTPREPAGRVWVVGARVLADPALQAYGQACLRLACRAGTPLLEVRFAAAGGALVVDAVKPVGALREGGESLLDALAAALAVQEATS